jgi:hypothetical protein
MFMKRRNALEQLIQGLLIFSIFQMIPLFLVALFWVLTLGGFSFIETVHSDGFQGVNVAYAMLVNSITTLCLMANLNDWK